MKVFHGSYTLVDEIDLTKSKDYRDFGKGFYVTKIRSQAEFWAVRKGRDRKTEGVVSEFVFYENAFERCDLTVLRFSGYDEQWLDFVVLNRDPQSPLPAHDYDIVEGPVANDDVNDRINDYLAGVVSKADFLKEITYYKPTHQICFCSVRSLQMIEPIDKKYYVYVKHISRPIIERLTTEQKISRYDATDMLYDSKTFSELSDKTTGLYQKPWTEIYDLLKNELKST